MVKTYVAEMSRSGVNDHNHRAITLGIGDTQAGQNGLSKSINTF